MPAGCPHGACNLTDSVAISANYVDYSNLALAIAELELACAEDARAKVVLDSLRQRQEEVAGVELDGKEAGGKDTDAAGGGSSAARSSSPGDAQGDSGHGSVPAVSHAVPAESSAAAAPLVSVQEGVLFAPAKTHAPLSFEAALAADAAQLGIDRRSAGTRSVARARVL